MSRMAELMFVGICAAWWLYTQWLLTMMVKTLAKWEPHINRLIAEEKNKANADTRSRKMPRHWAEE